MNFTEFIRWLIFVTFLLNVATTILLVAYVIHQHYTNIDIDRRLRKVEPSDDTH